MRKLQPLKMSSNQLCLPTVGWYVDPTVFHSLSYEPFAWQTWSSTRGYQKVWRLMQWNQYLLSYAYKVCRKYKTYLLWKFKLHVETLIIIYPQIHFIWYGHLAQSPLSSMTCHVIVFHDTFYTLIHFTPSTSKSNSNLNNLFYINIKSDKMLSEIDNVRITKRRV